MKFMPCDVRGSALVIIKPLLHCRRERGEILRTVRGRVRVGARSALARRRS